MSTFRKYVLVTVSIFILSIFLIVGVKLYRYLQDLIYGLGVVTDYSSSLSSSVTPAQATIPVASVTDRSGLNVITFTSSTLGDAAYFNIEPGTSRSEIVRCTSLSGTIWGGCTRGLPFGANGCNNTASTTLQLAHNAGSRIVQSNVCQIYNELVQKDTEQTMRGRLINQFGSITLGDGAATTTNNVILFDGSTDGIIRYNRSSNQLEFSNDNVSFSQFGSTSSIADAGRGLIREAGVGATSTVFQVATGTAALGAGLEFFNCRGTVPTCDLRVFASSTGGLDLSPSSTYTRGLAVSSTIWIGHANGIYGFTSSSLVIDADNQGTAATTSLVFHRGGGGNDNRQLRLEGSSGDFVLGYRNEQDLFRFASTTPAGTYGTSTLASNLVINGNIAFSTSTAATTASSTFSNNLIIRGNIGFDNHLLPTSNNTSDLGALGLFPFRNLYASSSLVVGTGGASTTLSSNGNLLFTNNNGDVGSFGSAVRDIYVSSSIRLGNGLTATTTILSNGNILLSGHLIPANNNSSNLGQATPNRAWANIFASNTLYIGGSSNEELEINSQQILADGLSGLTIDVQSVGLSLNTTRNQQITIGGNLLPNTNNARDLGTANLQFRAIYARSSSTIPRSFAAGQTTQGTDASPTSANLTVVHNLGTIPAKINITAVQRIYSILGEGTACCGVASTTASNGIWLNGVAPTMTPGANSSTYALPLNVGIGGAGGGSTTNTIMLISPTNGRSFARGVVTDVTSSTFVINFTLLNYSDTTLSPIQIQWEAEQ